MVLNDTAGGDVWLVNQNLMLVNNWDDLTVDQKNADNADKDSSDPNVVNTLPDRTKPNRPPLAEPDQFGVRAGSTTLLPVLYNDSDPDGDVLTVLRWPVCGLHAVFPPCPLSQISPPTVSPNSLG